MNEKTKLLIIWSTGDKGVAKYTAFMYALNSKRMGWWEEVKLIIWGPSGKILVEDLELQKMVKDLMEEGVILQACKGCSDKYDISNKLSELNIDVKYVGEDLTTMLKGNNWAVITY